MIAHEMPRMSAWSVSALVGKATTPAGAGDPRDELPEHHVDEKEPVRAWHHCRHELTRRPS